MEVSSFIVINCQFESTNQYNCNSRLGLSGGVLRNKADSSNRLKGTLLYATIYYTHTHTTHSDCITLIQISQESQSPDVPGIGGWWRTLSSVTQHSEHSLLALLDNSLLHQSMITAMERSKSRANNNCVLFGTPFCLFC